MRRSVQLWAAALLVAVLLALNGAPSEAAVVEQVDSPFDESLPGLPARVTLETIRSLQELVDVEEVIVEEETGKKSRVKPVATVPSGKYPTAFAEFPETIDVPQWCVGQEKILRFRTHKAQRILLELPGLRPGKMADPKKRYQAYGEHGRVLLVVNDDLLGQLGNLKISPLARLRAKNPGVLKGTITVYSSKKDKNGEKLDFWWNIIECQPKTEPTPTPAPVPNPQPTPLVLFVTPSPVATPSPTPTPVPTPKTETHFDANWSQGIIGQADGSGGHGTEANINAEIRVFDASGSFTSGKVEVGHSPDDHHDNLPVKNGMGVRISAHKGIQFGNDMASIGGGFNLKTTPGSSENGVPLEPFSIILRAQKAGEWLGFDLKAKSEIVWNYPDEGAHTVELTLKPKILPLGLAIGESGKLKADVGTSFHPWVLGQWYVAPSVALEVGLKGTDIITWPSPMVGVKTQF